MRILISLLPLVMFSSTLLAQPQIIVNSDQEFPTAVTSATFMPSPRFFGFAGFIPSDPIGMLQRKQFQKELELSEDQITIVEELQKDIQRQTQEVFASGAKFGGNAGKMMEAAQKAIRDSIEKELGEVLSPSQLKRLAQLEVQMSLKQRGARALTEEKFAKALGVSDEQKKEILDAQRASTKELHKAIEKLQQEHRKRLIKDMLTKEQLAKLEEISGQEFEVQQFNRRRAIRQ